MTGERRRAVECVYRACVCREARVGGGTAVGRGRIGLTRDATMPPGPLLVRVRTKETRLSNTLHTGGCLPRSTCMYSSSPPLLPSFSPPLPSSSSVGDHLVCQRAASSPLSRGAKTARVVSLEAEEAAQRSPATPIVARTRRDETRASEPDAPTTDASTIRDTRHHRHRHRGLCATWYECALPSRASHCARVLVRSPSVICSAVRRSGAMRASSSSPQRLLVTNPCEWG